MGRTAGHGIAFSERALVGLTAIHRYRYLSVAQFSEAAGLKPSFVRELLRDLERRSVLGSIGNVGLPGGSKAPKLYYLTESGHRLVSEALGPAGATLRPWRKPHKGTRWSPIMGHRMATVDLLLALQNALAARPDYRLIRDFLEYRRDAGGGRRAQPETSDYVADSDVPENRIVPDAAFILESAASGQRGLFFLEVDMATERIATGIDGAYSVLEKFRQYERYLTGGRFAETYRPWGDFRFFTVLFVTRTEGRLRSVVQSTQTPENRLMSYFCLAVFDKVSRDFLGKHWVSRGDREGAPASIVKR